MTPSSLARVLLLLVLSCAVVLLDGVVLLKAAAEQPSSSSSFHVPLPTIPSVQSLRSGAHDDVVKSAFFGKSAPGVLFVKGLNGFEKTREESLRRLSECATTKKKGRVEEDVFLRNSKAYSKEHPGVSRSTLAEFANKRLSMDVNAECAEGDADAFDLRRELEKLRDFADLVSQATLPRLDAILNANEGEDANRRPTRMERNFFSDALRSEASLDHFHVYASSDASSSSARRGSATR